MTRPRYGVDGFPYLVGLAAASTALGLVAVRAGRRWALLAATGSVAAAVPAALGLRYVLAGKARLQGLVTGAVAWRGDEDVADFGAGAGLLALAAATRTTGTVHAVDLFVRTDLSGNRPARLTSNARILGVAERVRVHESDVRRTPLPDAAVDVVVSSLCLHNLSGPAERGAALDEMLRVARPGATVVISDLAHVEDEYVPHLAGRGATVVRTAPVPWSFPPQRMLVARVRS